MKNNKAKVKKGITLIDVIISVALLSILIIPLSTMVITSLKNKEESSDRQKATYIGQKILEELKAYDVIYLKEDDNIKYFNLLDGLDSDREIREVSNNELKKFTGEFKRNIFGNQKDNPYEKLFNVEVNINKNEDFKNDLNYIDKTLAGYMLTFNENSIYYEFIKDQNDEKNKIPTSFIASNNIVDIEINKNILTLDNGTTKKDIPKELDKSNILIINLEDSYNKSTNINISNLQEKISEEKSINEALEIILIKNRAENNSINIIASEGDILVKEINLDDNLDLNDTYNYEIIVKDENNKEIFKAKLSSKLIIK